MATKKTTKKVDLKPTKKEVKHITPELIADVLAGKYGNEDERKHELLKAGYSPSAVTAKINKLKKLAEEVTPVKAKAGDYWGCMIAMIL